MHAIPYLFFNGHAKEAIDYYRSAIGTTDEQVMRYSDAPDQSGISPKIRDLVMHAQFKIGDTTIFLSDGEGKSDVKFDGHALAISADTVAEGERIFSALAKGGKVTQPLIETFFAEAFGKVQDKFGMLWMLMVPKPMNG